MRRIKAIVYGVGTMGRIITRCMVEKGVDVVGAIDVTPAIVGKDLGEVAGLGRPLNVQIGNDAVLSEQEADIAVVAIFAQMDSMYPYFKKCIENGLNVITTAEEALYPWGVSPELTAKLDRLAKKHGVTITGSGGQDNLRVNIITLLTGVSRIIESISIRQTADLSVSGAAHIAYYHVGDTKDEFYRKVKEEGITLNSLRISSEAVIADLGLTIKKVEQRIEPIIAETDVEAKGVVGGIVKKGLVAGMAVITDIETEQGIKLWAEKFSKVYNKDERAQAQVPSNECLIKGIPELHLKIHVDDIEAKASPVASLVNRIPDVINSEPGYITVEKLAKLKFRALPLGDYLNSRGGK